MYATVSFSELRLQEYNCRLDIAGSDIERGCGSPLLADYTRSISSQVLHMQTISTVIGRWPVWSDMRGNCFYLTAFAARLGSHRNGMVRGAARYASGISK
jgi:hypothetical protein